MKKTLIRKEDGDCYEKLLFFLLSTRGLHSHQESHPLVGEERRSQSGESERHNLCLFQDLFLSVCLTAPKL